MKSYILTAFILFLTISVGSAQVGIGTATPQEMLHVVGSMRIDSTQQASVTTTELSGLNNHGTLREIAVGTNLTLSNNVLRAYSPYDHSFGSISLPNRNDHNNVNLRLGPGEINEGKSIIRINRNGSPTDVVDITGFRNGVDGQRVWLYAQQGNVKLLADNTNSTVNNRIEQNAKKAGQPWSMIAIVYDGTRGKWIVMQNHGD